MFELDTEIFVPICFVRALARPKAQSERMNRLMAFESLRCCYFLASAHPRAVSQLSRVHSVLLGDVTVMEWFRGGSAVQQLDNTATAEAVVRIAWGPKKRRVQADCYSNIQGGYMKKQQEMWRGSNNSLDMADSALLYLMRD